MRDLLSCGTSAYAAANAIVKQKETLGLSREQLEALSNTISERSKLRKESCIAKQHT